MFITLLAIVVAYSIMIENPAVASVVVSQRVLLMLGLLVSGLKGNLFWWRYEIGFFLKYSDE